MPYKRANKKILEGEISNISNIYSEEEFRCSVGQHGKTNGTFSAYVSLPERFGVFYRTCYNGKFKNVILPIKHLPPIELAFELTEFYPTSMPKFTLSCPWVPFKKMLKLCQLLTSLWEGSRVLLPWIEALKAEAPKLIGKANRLNITTQHLSELKRAGKLRFRSGKEPKWVRRLGTRTVEHPRIVVKNPEIPLHQVLQDYNEKRQKLLSTRQFLCEICFEQTSGAEGSQFSPCNHVYCKSCVGSYFEARIAEGLIISMPCPYEKCVSEAYPNQVKDTMKPELFAKYDSLLMAIMLERMEDITYCPRITCGTAVVKQEASNSAICPTCSYLFCVSCRQSFHGNQPCQSKAEIMKIVSNYQNGSPLVKSKMEIQYGKDRIKSFIEDKLSNDWIKDNSKTCPSCKAKIEKSDGCNKMVCGKCLVHFCWLCLAVLDKSNPYDHFNNPKSKCKDALFLGVHEGAEEMYAVGAPFGPYAGNWAVETDDEDEFDDDEEFGYDGGFSDNDEEEIEDYEGEEVIPVGEEGYYGDEEGGDPGEGSYCSDEEDGEAGEGSYCSDEEDGQAEGSYYSDEEDGQAEGSYCSDEEDGQAEGGYCNDEEDGQAEGSYCSDEEDGQAEGSYYSDEEESYPSNDQPQGNPEQGCGAINVDISDNQEWEDSSEEKSIEYVVYDYSDCDDNEEQIEYHEPYDDFDYYGYDS